MAPELLDNKPYNEKVRWVARRHRGQLSRCRLPSRVRVMHVRSVALAEPGRP